MNECNELGQRHGYWEHYYFNGNISTKGTYSKNKRHGYWEDYLQDGKLNWLGHFDNDERIGYWEWHAPVWNKAVLIEKEFYL